MLLLILSILLVITSSLALNTYIRLNNASNTYSTDDAFENSCHVSTTYVKDGKILMISVLVLSAGLMLIAAWNNFRN